VVLLTGIVSAAEPGLSVDAFPDNITPGQMVSFFISNPRGHTLRFYADGPSYENGAYGSLLQTELKIGCENCVNIGSVGKGEANYYWGTSTYYWNTSSLLPGIYTVYASDNIDEKYGSTQVIIDEISANDTSSFVAATPFIFDPISTEPATLPEIAASTPITSPTVTTTPITIPTVATTPVPTPPIGENSGWTLPIIVTIPIVLLAGGYYVIRSRKSDRDSSKEEQGKVSKPVPEQHFSPPSGKPVAKRSDPTPPPPSNPHLARIESAEKSAQNLTLFRTPVDDLLFLSREYFSKGKKTDGENVLKDAENAIPLLRYCESQLFQWKTRGFDTTPLETLRTGEVQQIESAFRKFQENVEKLDKVRSAIAVLKKKHPSIITQPEIQSGITSLEQYLKKPDSVTVALSELERLNKNLIDSAQEKERLEHHLQSQIMRIQQVVSDISVLTETNGIMKILMSGNLPASEQQFKNLVSHQEIRVNQTIASLRNEGAVIPKSIMIIEQKADDREYGHRVIETSERLMELNHLQEQFRQATALKGSITDTRLLHLFDIGKYEEFITGCKNQGSTLKKESLIFISSKSEDTEYAKTLYEFLKSRGKNVFFAEESLPKLANSVYIEEINAAIDKAAHMIVVGSSVKNITARWVKAEWNAFINEKLSGRKSERSNLITITTKGIEIGDLPLALRQNQVISFDPDLFDRVLDYIPDLENPSTAEMLSDPS
jgi:hypothetical protein